MKSIAIIPARSGSKGLPNKNIIELDGKPLMYYTIKAALESNCFDEIMVSTDSKEYAEIARKCGANVPFLRSEEMSSDSAGSWDVVREVLKNYAKKSKHYDFVALLQPTSPLRNADDIRTVFDQMKMLNANNATTITETEHPVQWCFKLLNDQSMNEMAKSPFRHSRRQELEPYYRENGAIYVVDAKKIMNPDYNFYGDKCIGCKMNKERSIDIDEELDLLIVKEYMKRMHK